MITRTFPEYLPNLSGTLQSFTAPAAAATLNSLLSTPLHAQTDAVLIQIETDQVRISPTGGTPSTSLGFLINPTQAVMMSRQEWDAGRIIRVTSAATVQVFEYKRQ
jgi:hypothetical protein